MDKSELIVQHYQETYQLTNQLWQQRNKLFLILLGFIAFASISTYSPETNKILISWLGKNFNIKDPEQLKVSIPLAMLQGIFLLIIFYLMVNLFHRSLYVLRNYSYLGELEKEIRTLLSLHEEDHSFTRESKFYWKDRPWVLSTVKFVYIFFLGSLLLLFFYGKISKDWNSGLLLTIDFGLAVPTVGYFIAYSYYSIGLDKT